MIFQEGVTLSSHSTIGIGGKAQYFVTAKTIQELKQAITYANERTLPVFVISGGSNTIFSDDGYSGLVIRIAFEGIKILKENDKNIFIQALAGTNWDTFVKYSVKNGYQGVECLSGIPGSVGATPIQNVGAYGQEVSQTIQSVECIDTTNFKKRIFVNTDCKFSYRDSYFKRAPHIIVTSVIFKLTKTPNAIVSYPQLSQQLSSKPQTLKKIRSVVLTLRKKKSMLLLPSDKNTKSVGSFFKNPIIAKRHFTLLYKKCPNIPYWKVDNSFKISAAWLIETSGFTKGYSFNRNIGLSAKHCLAIINKGKATSDDLANFIHLLQKTVFDTFSIQLVPEPILVGFHLKSANT